MNDRCLFRVWCENKKEWEKDEILISSKGRFVLMQKGIPITKDTMPKHHIVEFCTGLKDKNGKLVFENDIVKGTFFHALPELNFIGTIFWHNDVAGFGMNEWDLATIEVIGNIHQDSHLLENNGIGGK